MLPTPRTWTVVVLEEPDLAKAPVANPLAPTAYDATAAMSTMSTQNMVDRDDPLPFDIPNEDTGAKRPRQ